MKCKNLNDLIEQLDPSEIECHIVRKGKLIGIVINNTVTIGREWAPMVATIPGTYTIVDSLIDDVVAEHCNGGHKSLYIHQKHKVQFTENLKAYRTVSSRLDGNVSFLKRNFTDIEGIRQRKEVTIYI